MPFSHHSHSGQFCGHATDTLEEVIQRAIALKMKVFAMTEHMPRDLDEDLYPEEVRVTYPLRRSKLTVLISRLAMDTVVLVCSKSLMLTIVKPFDYARSIPHKSIS